MQVATIPVGMLEVNCYLAWDDASRQALIIDPGDDAATILRTTRRLDLKPWGILLTHAHVDHIRAVGPLAAALGIPVALHADDAGLYRSPANALPPWLDAAEDLPEPGSVPTDLPGLVYKRLHTPGHTPGGCSYYFPDGGTLFSGDTLFAGGIGRTDLPGGDTEQLLTSIRNQLFTLPPETVVYPGHGPATAIGTEVRTNSFL